MKRFVVLVAIALSQAGVALAAGVTVAPHPEWQPATPEQMQAVAQSDAYEVVDFSLRESGGAAILLRAPATVQVDKSFYEGSLSGFVKSMTGNGYTIIEQHPASIGPLPGVCVTTEGNPDGNPMGVISFLVYSTTDMYTVSVYGPQGLTADDPLVAAYLARIEFDATVTPGAIETTAAIEMGKKIGKSIGYIAGAAAVVGAVIALMIVVSSRKKSKPPPLPTV